MNHEIFTLYNKQINEVWLRQHPEFKIAKNACTIEWYAGTDIKSPDYQCGVMFLLED